MKLQKLKNVKFDKSLDEYWTRIYVGFGKNKFFSYRLNRDGWLSDQSDYFYYDSKIDFEISPRLKNLKMFKDYLEKT